MNDTPKNNKHTVFPTVSIVMPSLNQAAFIERSIRSVMTQSGKFTLKLIVMDGGSTDGTLKILKHLHNKYPNRLLFYSEPDRGPAHALNKAITISDGDIIGWLNADDMYAPGAISRAVDALRNKPELVMIYGHGQHIDMNDQVLGTYPTRQPDVGLEAFNEGCFICQPTAFLRKQALNDLGLLNESLKTAFDFELWLRIFSVYPKRIGFIDATQAKSRLHDDCITLSQRSIVIREGMQLLSDYFGAAPLHWFKTYINDQLAACPYDRQIGEIKDHLASFANSIKIYLSPHDQAHLQQVLQDDARIQLALPGAFLDLYPDGWLPPMCDLRISRLQGNLSHVVLHGQHTSNIGRLKLVARSSDGAAFKYTVKKRGSFSIKISLTGETRFPDYQKIIIESEDYFIPSKVQSGSEDNRKVVCRIERIRTYPLNDARLFRNVFNRANRFLCLNRFFFGKILPGAMLND